MKSVLVAAGCALGMYVGAFAQARDPQGGEVRSDAGSVSGRVEIVEPNQRTPLRRAVVRVRAQDARLFGESTTDTDGRFAFGALPAGSYGIEVLKPGFVISSGTATVDVAQNAQATLNLEVGRAGALAGRITDERGLPLEKLKVNADRIDNQTDGNQQTYVATTDDLGRFRIHTLPPGRYRLSAKQTAFEGQQVFFPGTTASADAGIVAVATGETASGLDFVVPASAESAAAAEIAAAFAQSAADGPESPDFPGRISGRVSRSDNGMPIPNATIHIYTSTGLSLRTVASDGNGRFAFPRLPVGGFVVDVTASGYVNESAATAGPVGAGLRVSVSDAFRHVVADFALVPSCSIEVRVVDEFGDPAPGVRLAVSRKRSAAPESEPHTLGAPATTGLTDDRGWFRVYRLPPGEYFVGSVAESIARASATMFAATYFPGTNADAAMTVRLGGGAENADVAFPLIVARTAAVSGIVVNAQGERVPGLDVRLAEPIGPSEAATFARTAEDGSFVFRVVPEGIYMLLADGPKFFGSMRVAAAPATDPPLHVFTVREPITVRGTIVFEGDTQGLDLRRVVGLSWRPTGYLPMSSIGRRQSTTRVGQGGVFEIINITTSGVIYATNVSFGGVPPWRLLRVVQHGRDITDVPIEVENGDVSGLEVILTTRLGTLSGVVKADGAGPAASVSIFLFGADGESQPYIERTRSLSRTNADGTFQIEGLVPGRYYVLARRTPTLPGLAELQTLRPHATVVVITAGTTTNTALTISR